MLLSVAVAWRKLCCIVIRLFSAILIKALHEPAVHWFKRCFIYWRWFYLIYTLFIGMNNRMNEFSVFFFQEYIKVQLAPIFFFANVNFPVSLIISAKKLLP